LLCGFSVAARFLAAADGTCLPHLAQQHLDDAERQLAAIESASRIARAAGALCAADFGGILTRAHRSGSRRGGVARAGRLLLPQRLASGGVVDALRLSTLRHWQDLSAAAQAIAAAVQNGQVPAWPLAGGPGSAEGTSGVAPPGDAATRRILRRRQILGENGTLLVPVFGRWINEQHFTP